ncbi:Tetratricopeptide repeat protein [uncultured archaeon]|nr:Tetratricopeptide repeat protein [uncultured archaeon]
MADFVSECQRLLSEGKYSEALSLSEKQLEEKPEYDAAWRMNGLALQGLGRTEEAAERFRKAISYGKSDANNHHAYAALMFNMKRFEDALLLFEAAETLDPTPERLFMVAIADLMLGRRLDAVLAMKEAIAMNKEMVAATARSFSEKYLQDNSVQEEDKKALRAQLDRLMRSA